MVTVIMPTGPIKIKKVSNDRKYVNLCFVLNVQRGK